MNKGAFQQPCHTEGAYLGMDKGSFQESGGAYGVEASLG